MNCEYCSKQTSAAHTCAGANKPDAASRHWSDANVNGGAVQIDARLLDFRARVSAIRPELLMNHVCRSKAAEARPRPSANHADAASHWGRPT